MANKFFSLVLHSHIPYVLAHGSWPHGMDWLYEASAESYLPLLRVCMRLRDEGIRPCVNISFTPVLMEQLGSPGFSRTFKQYLEARIACARQDRADFEKTGAEVLGALAAYWEKWYEDVLEFFGDGCREDILAACRSLQDDGLVEVLTSAATHGYLPLLSKDDSVRWQVRQGVLAYEKYFGRRPPGFWLPECGYRPGYPWRAPLGDGEEVDRAGLDEILKQERVGCFFVDGHLLRGGVVAALYDTELFGHWWFEGPEWLYLVLKKLSVSGVRPATVSRCLEALPPRQTVSLPEGSWGEGGFHWVWLNDDTSWIWEKIYRIEEEAVALANRSFPGKTRVLKQFIREKFLLESSDWPFLISTGSARDYAANRAEEHFDRAWALRNWLVRPEPLGLDEGRLLDVWDQEDGIFSEVVTPDGNII